MMINIGLSVGDYKALVFALHQAAWVTKEKIYYEAEHRFVSTDEDKKSRHKQLEQLYKKWGYIEDTLYELVHDYLEDALKLVPAEDEPNLEDEAKEAMAMYESEAKIINDIFKRYKVGVYAKK